MEHGQEGTTSYWAERGGWRDEKVPLQQANSSLQVLTVSHETRSQSKLVEWCDHLQSLAQDAATDTGGPATVAGGPLFSRDAKILSAYHFRLWWDSHATRTS